MATLCVVFSRIVPPDLPFITAVQQEDTLGKLFKKGGGGLGVIGSLIGKGGTRFNGLDIKRVYFGFVQLLYSWNSSLTF